MKHLSLFPTLALLVCSIFAQVNDEQQIVINRDKIFQEANRRRDQDIVERLKSRLPKIKFNRLTKKQKKILEASEENLNKYASFLKQPQTGIFRILAKDKCNSKVLNVNDENCYQMLSIYGQGAMFSFLKGTHITAEDFYNIVYTNEKIIANFESLGIGFFIGVNDKNLDSVDETTKEVKVLNSFTPVSKRSLLYNQKAKLRKGFLADGKIYSTEITAKLGAIYVLRSVNYVRKPRNGFNYGIEKEFYEDITVAFQIVEQDTYGNLTIIWKEIGKRRKGKLSA